MTTFGRKLVPLYGIGVLALFGIVASQVEPAQAQPAAFPPIPQGFYAVGGGGYPASCEEAARDEHGLSHMYLTPRFWQDWDGGSRITRITQAGSGIWRLQTTEWGAITIQVTGPDSFREHPVTEDSRTFRHCADSIVPAQTRRDLRGN